MRKYRHLAKELEERFGDQTVGAVSVDEIREMRESWKLSGMTTAKRLELAAGIFLVLRGLRLESGESRENGSGAASDTGSDDAIY